MSRGLAVFLAIMAGLFILVANFSLWLGSSIFNKKAFSETAVTVIRTRQVRDTISAGIMKEILKEAPELSKTVQSALKDIFSSLLASNAAKPILEDLANGVNESLTAQNPKAVKLNVEKIIDRTQPFIDAINQEFDVNITTDEVPKSIVVIKKGEIPSIYGWGVPLLWLGPILGVFGLALIIGSIVFAGQSRAMVLRINGIVLAISALLFLLLTRFAATPLSILAQDEKVRVIALKLFDAFSAKLSAQTWLLFGVGILLTIGGFILSRFTGETRPQA